MTTAAAAPEPVFVDTMIMGGIRRLLTHNVSDFHCLEKNQRGKLTDRERLALGGLRAVGDRLMLQRSHASVLLKYRGQRLPNLGDLELRGI